MGTPDLIAALQRDTEERATAVLTEARARAKEILAAADRTLAERRRRQLTDHEEPLRLEAMRQIAAEQRRAQAAALVAREKAIERILERAADLLGDPSTLPRYMQVLESHLEEALSFTGGSGAQVICPPSIASEVEQLLRNRTHLRVETSPEAELGIVVRCDDPEVLIDNSLRGRLERYRPLARTALVRRLEGAR